MVNLSPQALEDAVQGASVTGSGNSGSKSDAAYFLERTLASGKDIPLKRVQDLADDTVVCRICLLGVANPTDKDNIGGEEAVMLAVHKIQESFGRTVRGIIPGESDACNLALVSYVASKIEDGFVVDAAISGSPDAANRAFPRRGSNGGVGTLAMASMAGELTVLECVKTGDRAMYMVDVIRQISKGRIVIIDYAMTIEEVRPILSLGLVSKALYIGRDMREAKEDKTDLAEATVRRGGGKVLFRGVIKTFSTKYEMGFNHGEVGIEGTKQFEGRECQVFSQNEILAAWLDGQVRTTIPERICIIGESGTVSSPEYKSDMPVSVVVLPAAQDEITEEGLKRYGPAIVGLNYEFKSAFED